MERPATYREYIQRVLDARLRPVLDTSPAAPPDIFIGNKIDRVIASLLGACAGRAILLEATPRGALKVHTTGASKFVATQFTGADAITSYNVIQLGYVGVRCDVWVLTNAWDLYLAGAAYDASQRIRIPAGGFYSCDVEFLQVYGMNSVAGSNATVYVVGWMAEV